MLKHLYPFEHDLGPGLIYYVSSNILSILHEGLSAQSILSRAIFIFGQHGQPSILLKYLFAFIKLF